MMRSPLFPVTLLVFAFLLTANAHAQTCPAAAGCLDTTFGTDGKVLVAFSFIVPAPEGMVVQSDGKIVSVSGGFSAGHKLVRLNADGSLDTSFGGDGSVEFTWLFTSGGSSYYGKGYGVALQTVGGEQRIVVAGAGHLISGRKIIGNVLRLQRFMPDGSVDTSFGINGTIVHNTGYALTMAVQPDGKIVTVGDAGKLARLNVNGSLDTSFGSGGIVAIDYGRALAIDSNGGILVGGFKKFGNGNSSRNEMSVQRFLPNGTVDTSFGSAGRAVADFGVGSQLWEVQIDLVGRIVAGGNSNGSFAAARFTPNGQLDTSFNGSGRATGPNGNGRGTAVQLDGRIVVTGQYNNDFRLARFNADGSLDATFGSGGVVTLDVYGNDYTNRTVIQTDPACACEKIVMSGGSDPQISFARFTTF